jgi:hypothetical protein
MNTSMPGTFRQQTLHEFHTERRSLVNQFGIVVRRPTRPTHRQRVPNAIDGKACAAGAKGDDENKSIVFHAPGLSQVTAPMTSVEVSVKRAVLLNRWTLDTTASSAVHCR